MSKLRRAVVGSVAVLVALTPTASAQEADGLSGYVGTASGAAWSIQPIFPGLFPTGDAPFEVTLALTNSNVKSGGTSYAQAAAAWPGSAIAGIGPLLGAASGDLSPIASQLPPYPLAVQASQDDGEVELGGRPGPWLRARGEAQASEGTAQAGGTDIPGVLEVKSVSSTSRTFLEDDKLIAESVVTLTGVSIGDGAVTMDTVRSISSATSDGTVSTSNGSTNVTGLKVQGAEAVLTADGIEAKEAPTPDVALPTQEAVAPLDEVLEQLGISIEATPVSGQSEGPAGDHIATALHLTVQNPAAAANPQFTGSRFEISLASTAAGAVASPPFAFEFDDEFDFADPVGGSGGFDDIATTTQQTIRRTGAAISDLGGSSPLPAGGGGPAAIITEPLGSALEYVGGVTPALVAGWAFAAVIGARWVSRYVGRIVSIEE